MLERIQQLADPLDRALVAATAGQLLLLGDVAPRDVSSALTRALSTETSPALDRAVPGPGAPGRRPVGAGRRVPRPAGRARRRRGRARRRARRPPGGPAHARGVRLHRRALVGAAGGRRPGDRPRPGLADGRAPRRARRLRRGRRTPSARVRPRPGRRHAPPRGARRPSRRRGQGGGVAGVLRRLRRAGQPGDPRARLDVLASRPGRAPRAVRAPLPRGAAHAQGRAAQPGAHHPRDVPPRCGRRVVPRRRRGRGRRHQPDGLRPQPAPRRTRSCSAGSCRPAGSDAAACSAPAIPGQPGIADVVRPCTA